MDRAAVTDSGKSWKEQGGRGLKSEDQLLEAQRIAETDELRRGDVAGNRFLFRASRTIPATLTGTRCRERRPAR